MPVLSGCDRRALKEFPSIHVTMICFLLTIQSLWTFVAASRQSHSAPDLNLVEKEHVSSLPRLDSSSSDDILRRIDAGSPFIIRSIANEWPATQKWNHNYFKRIFSSNDDLLVSSTFSTTPPPSTFSANETKKRETYYGIFLNDPILANLVAADYDLPSFIPGDWWLRGNEWLHWGWSPSGARRHVDLMCSSRMSVQVRGQKRWKFYPLVNTSSTQYKDVRGSAFLIN